MNKKHIYIATFIATGVITLGSFANALALAIKPVNNATFGISQAKSYYLKGSFNDWTASNEYMLEDMTSTMEPDENKISEFTISKALSKDDELKIWDSFNHWYEQGTDNCSYRDKWNRGIGNGDNYVVPMTATYSIYLKFYSTGDKQIYLDAPDLTTLYLKPNANWVTDSARFAAYFFNDSTSTNEWRDMTQDGDYYSVSIPSGYSNVIFCRMNPGTTENSWSNKWNQTANLDFNISSYKNAYELPSGAWDDSNNDYWGSR